MYVGNHKSFLSHRTSMGALKTASILGMSVTSMLIPATAIAQSGGSGSGAWHANLGADTASPSKLDGTVRALYSDGGSRCYVGGGFNAPFNGVAYWNGTDYEAVGTITWTSNSSVNAFAWYEEELYAAGRFELPTGPDGTYSDALLMRLDKSNGEGIWLPVLISSQQHEPGEGMALEVHDEVLWIGGDYTLDNGRNNLSWWDGSQSAPANHGGGGSDGPVYALEVHEGKLYAGGDFDNVGFGCSHLDPDCPFDEANLAVYDEGSWNEAFGGVKGSGSPEVYALHSVDSGSNTGLYIGGRFNTIGGNSGLNSLAFHDPDISPNSIASMDGGVAGEVYAIQRWGGGISVGGEFDNVGSDELEAFNIASWTETSGWRSLDKGVFGSITDMPFGAAVLALCSHGNGQADGVYAGGNFMVHGSSENLNFHAAKFVRVLMVGPSEDYINSIANGSLDATSGPYWRFSQLDDAEPASCNWGVQHATFQRIAWNSASLVVGERLDFSCLSQDGSFDISIWREQGPGPFLPPIEVLEFDLDSMNSNLNARIVCLTNDGQYVEMSPFQMNEALHVINQSATSALTISNGFFWKKNDVAVIELSEAGTIESRGEMVENVKSFAFVMLENEPSVVDSIQMNLVGDLEIDFASSGFGFQGNLHKVDGEQDFSIENGNLALEMEPDSALDIMAVIDGYADGTEWNNVNAELAFMVQDGTSDWLISIEAQAGIEVGTPGDTFTLAGNGNEGVNCDYKSSEDDRDQPHMVRVMQFDEVIAEFSIPNGQLEFTTHGIQGQSPFRVGFDTAENGGFINWTEPGLVVFGGGHDLPPIEGPTGLIIGKTEGADGDDIWDVVQQMSLKITARKRTKLHIFEELFTPFFADEEESIPGDINNDGRVDGQDLAELLGSWGTDAAGADINEDGLVDGQDLAQLLGNWN